MVSACPLRSGDFAHIRAPSSEALRVRDVLRAALHQHQALFPARLPWATTSGFAMLSFAGWGVLVGMTLGRALNVVVRCMRHASGSSRGGFPYSVDS
ncbi:hypothetical protein DIE03_19855 [Burkholderia sp. Bp8992]|nr:hypothetical protein DIE03_19855 [Burkholderia sp. Bp8992]